MDREPGRMGAVAALMIALAFGLLLAWSQSTQGPSRAELAAALSIEAGRVVAASDIRSIRCAGQSIGYDCRWEQQVDEVWRQRGGRLATDVDGWRLVKDSAR